MLYRNILSLTIIWMSVVESFSLEVQKRCVPTASEHGPCHVCVCSTAGVFHCLEVDCSEEDMVNLRLNKRECEPHYVYRQENVICSCSEEGFWLSTKCRNEFHFLRPKNALIRVETKTNVDCTPNSFYLIDCNICQCSANGFIEISSCTNRRCNKGHKADYCSTGDYLRVNDEICACSDINFYINRLCIKIEDQKMQKLKDSDVANMVDIGKNWRDINEIRDDVTCVPNVVYTIDCNTCSCSSETRKIKCTRFKCLDDEDNKKDIRAGVKQKKNKFYLLPELKSEDEKCVPGQKYRFKCNTCSCSDDMEPSCTTMVCLDDFVLDLRALIR